MMKNIFLLTLAFFTFCNTYAQRYQRVRRIQDVTEYNQLTRDGQLLKTISELTSSAPVPGMGSPKIPVILVQFSDRKFSIADTDDDVAANYQQFFNAEEGVQPGQTGHESACSVKEYFRQQSGGKFTPEFTIIGPVTVSKSYTYYGGRQFPPEENVISLSAAEMLTVFGGLRSAQGALANWYIDVFQAEDGSVKMARGEWTGDGYTEVFTMKSASDPYGLGKEYELVLVDENGAEKHLTAKLYDAGNVISINLTGSEDVAYSPDDYENHKIHTGAEFVILYSGTWHCDKEKLYAHFELSGGKPVIVFGSWGSTDVYPTADILAVKQLGKMHYTLTIQKSDESHTRDCDFVISQGGEMTITDNNGEVAVFVYDPSRQLSGSDGGKG